MNAATRNLSRFRLKCSPLSARNGGVDHTSRQNSSHRRQDVAFLEPVLSGTELAIALPTWSSKKAKALGAGLEDWRGGALGAGPVRRPGRGRSLVRFPRARPRCHLWRRAPLEDGGVRPQRAVLGDRLERRLRRLYELVDWRARRGAVALILGAGEGAAPMPPPGVSASRAPLLLLPRCAPHGPEVVA